MKVRVSSKGQVTLPKAMRDALGIDTGSVLEVERGAAGSFVLRKKAVPGFFNQFKGLKAEGAPFASGDEAREALRVAEDQAAYGTERPRRRRKRG